MSELAALQAVHHNGLGNYSNVPAPAPVPTEAPVYQPPAAAPIQQVQPSHIAPGLYNNMAVPNGFHQPVAQTNGFVNMNNIQAKPMNMQFNNGHQQPQATSNAFAGPSGTNGFQNGAMQLPQTQHVAATSAPPIAPSTQPVASVPASKPVLPVTPPPTIVDLTALSDDSPKGPARDVVEMNIDPTPFDDLGSISSPAVSPRPMNVIAPVSTRLEVPRVPPNYNSPRVSSAADADSSSFAQAPAPRPLKRPVPPTSKYKFLGPSISNNPELGALAPLLTPGALQREQPKLLFSKLRTRGAKGKEPPLFQPTPRQLILILAALQKGASNTYLRLMADHEFYSEVIAAWVRAMTNDPETYEPGIANLFNLLARTNMPVDYIERFKMKYHTEALLKAVQEKGLRSLPEIERAYNRYYNYLQDDLFRANRRMGNETSDESSDNSSGDERMAKKRKTSSRPDVKPVVRPAAKPAAKPDVKPNVAKAGASAPKTGLSFFAGPPKADVKPKPNLKGLPSFKKRPAPLVTPSAPAGPSRPPGGSLLASTMKRLKNDPSPPPSAPAPTAKPEVKVKNESKLNRKGHTVRWVDDAPGYSATSARPLVAVREFTEEPHELAPAPWRLDEGAHGMSVHQLDRAEGNVMHHRVYDEVEAAMAWSEPAPYDAPYVGPPEPTSEAVAQEQRERGILAVSYVAGQEPITPDDIGVRVVSQDATTAQVNTQHHYPGSGSDVAPVAVPAPVPASAPAPAPAMAPTSVSDLLRNLNLPNLTPAAPAPAPAYGGYDYQPSQPAGYGYQSPQPAYGHQSPQPAYGRPPANRWDQNRAPGLAAPQAHASHAPHGQGYNPNPNRGAWRGGRGGYSRGGGYRTRTCRFWLEGNCKEGESCTFLHDRR